MLITHAGLSPRIHPAAYVAPNAVVCGDVRIGAGCRILFGAQVVAEGGSIEIGENTIVMENAVLRSTARHSLVVGNHCLVGPQAHVVGCTLEDEVFVATGAAIFHAAQVGRGSEVRIHAVVHLKTQLPAGTTVPIGWVAVGEPAELLPPGEHERIWALQQPLDFPLTVYGLQRSEADMVKITRGLSQSLAAHRDDRVHDAS
ncbi:gamma carbonic anhydrase family protein [Eleftheria terrae]|uniref:gamma carbonic anhydrase family protein n=1 Tax=Eleftheria terrae TaxID=1597781 RepID=UPI00263B8E03|nr:gamma carbonic anhydrase family protein [Eleftheria terrae]WKB52369.1 gamma carbonic anhydrase family protein [Eleftheria terrae]